MKDPYETSMICDAVYVVWWVKAWVLELHATYYVTRGQFYSEAQFIYL